MRIRATELFRAKGSIYPQGNELPGQPSILEASYPGKSIFRSDWNEADAHAVECLVVAKFSGGGLPGGNTSESAGSSRPGRRRA
jgi:hypothetical protein